MTSGNTDALPQSTQADENGESFVSSVLTEEQISERSVWGILKVQVASRQIVCLSEVMTVAGALLP